MKKISDIQTFDKIARERDKVTAIQMMLLQQIENVGSIMERNSDLVKNPYAYNHCAGLLEQLRLHAFSAFISSGGAAPEIPDGNKPTIINILYGE